jgi:hypothetical protein
MQAPIIDHADNAELVAFLAYHGFCRDYLIGLGRETLQSHSWRIVLETI